MPDAGSAWVALVEYTSPQLSAPIGDEGLELTYLGQVLLDAGIEAAFEPFRPGEGGTLYAPNFAQPVRLMVHRSDLDRAMVVARDALSSGPESR